MGGSAGFLVQTRRPATSPGRSPPDAAATDTKSAPGSTHAHAHAPPHAPAGTTAMPPFVGAVYRELLRCLSSPNSLAILEATAKTVGLRRERLGARHLPDLVAHVQASFSFFGVPQERRDECLARLRDLAGAPSALAAAVPVAIPIQQEGDIVRARLAGKLLCRELRFSDGCTAKVVAAISELARNIFKHARRGTVTVRSTPGEPAGIEIVATDSGPGIADVGALLAADGRGLGPGAGLRGARDLADSFEVVSRPGAGTTVTFRKTRVG